MKWAARNFVLLVFASCTPGESEFPALTARLSALFPRFEELHLIAYRKQDWCSVLETKSGSFATNERETCTYIATTAPKPFTPEARQELADLAGAVESAFSRVYIIDRVIYSPEGKLTRAEFDFSAPFSRHSFVYEPGYTLPTDMGGEMQFKRIDENWYYVWEDWN